MSFREALRRHLAALQSKKLHATPVEIREGADMGFAVLHLLYCEDPPGKRPLRQQSHLTLVFERRDDRWLMVLDQNTPIK